jgi:hypothetical protein
MKGASEVTELAAVEDDVSGPGGSDSELGGSVSVGDEERVDMDAPTQRLVDSVVL